jgi:ribosomal protein S18 acetylase RimI-like enzyme
MALTNYERMIQLAEDVFATRTDPEQLDVNQAVIEHLLKIHPSTVSEYNEGKGPCVWILVIPTTRKLMQQFLDKKISEKELYTLTPLAVPYEAIYLCSALTLEEYRGKGIATKLTTEAIEQIKKEQPIAALFVWPFSEEGKQLAEKIAKLTQLPLYYRLT